MALPLAGPRCRQSLVCVRAGRTGGLGCSGQRSVHPSDVPRTPRHSGSPTGRRIPPLPPAPHPGPWMTTFKHKPPTKEELDKLISIRLRHQPSGWTRVIVPVVRVGQEGASHRRTPAEGFPSGWRRKSPEDRLSSRPSRPRNISIRLPAGRLREHAVCSTRSVRSREADPLLSSRGCTPDRSGRE
jgi:hypothetical protein